MAVDIFIKIGDIKGESMDKAHKDEIDVLNWSWGMAQSGNMHVGGGGGAGKVNIQDLSLTKYVDKASPNLMMHCASGKQAQQPSGRNEFHQCATHHSARREDHNRGQ